MADIISFEEFLSRNREKALRLAIHNPTIEQFEDGEPEPEWDEIAKQHSVLRARIQDTRGV